MPQKNAAASAALFWDMQRLSIMEYGNYVYPAWERNNRVHKYNRERE